jgi:hypothetical protein
MSLCSAFILISFLFMFNNSCCGGHCSKQIIIICLFLGLTLGIGASAITIKTYLQIFENDYQIQKPNKCPNYTTTNTSSMMISNNLTACFCNNLGGPTLLGFQTTGIQCCDCPLELSCS